MLELFLRSDARFMAAVGSFCAVAAVVGLLLHLLYFIHGFRVLQVKNMIVSHLVGLGLVLAETTSTFGPWKGLVAYVAISSAYFAALFLSIVTYRLFFHPLRHFPGPFPAKITKLHTPWIARHGKLHWEYAKLHQRYGEFVRVGELASSGGDVGETDLLMEDQMRYPSSTRMLTPRSMARSRHVPNGILASSTAYTTTASTGSSASRTMLSIARDAGSGTSHFVQKVTDVISP